MYIYVRVCADMRFIILFKSRRCSNMNILSDSHTPTHARTHTISHAHTQSHNAHRESRSILSRYLIHDI